MQRAGASVPVELFYSLGLLSINLLHLLILYLLQLLLRPLYHIRQHSTALLPILEHLVMLRPRLSHAVPPPLRSLLDALDQLLLPLELHAQQQFQVVVLRALRLLVEVPAGLHGRHDGLDICLVVYEEGNRAAGAGHDLRQFAQREGVCVGGFILDGDGEGAEGVGVEAAAVDDVGELRFEVAVDGAVGRCQGGEVEGVFGVWGGRVFGGC